MAKSINNGNIEIRKFLESDFPLLEKAFKRAKLPRPIEKFQTYFEEQKNNERIVWIALCDDQIAGHITLRWRSEYKPFLNKKIPEIKDLIVIKKYRKYGVGSFLLDIAEGKASKKSSVIGIGVGLDIYYGTAQKLYVTRGFIPDGNGITHYYDTVKPTDNVMYDDEFVLWLTKRVR